MNITEEVRPIDEMDEMWNVLTPEERIYLRENTRLQRFKKNELIYVQGSVPTHMIYLVEGKVKIFKEGIGGRVQIVRMAQPRDFFAYRAYLVDEKYSTNGAAVESSLAYLIPMKVMYQIIESNNKMALAFIKMLARDLGVADERTVSLTQKHIRGRLAETIVMLLDHYGTLEDGVTLTSRLSREDLASHSNMTTSNAIRTLSNFAAEGILEVDGRTIKVLDEDKLRKTSRLG